MMCVKGRWQGARAVWRVGLSGPVSLGPGKHSCLPHTPGWLAGGQSGQKQRLASASRVANFCFLGRRRREKPSTPSCPGSCRETRWAGKVRFLAQIRCPHRVSLCLRHSYLGTRNLGAWKGFFSFLKNLFLAALGLHCGSGCSLLAASGG